MEVYQESSLNNIHHNNIMHSIVCISDTILIIRNTKKPLQRNGDILFEALLPEVDSVLLHTITTFVAL